MSLILEALKKSEARRQLGEAPGLGTPFTVTPRRRNPLPLIIVLALVAAGFGWYYLRTTPAPVVDTSSAAANTISARPTPPVASAVPSTRQTPPMSVQPPPSPVAQPAASNPAMPVSHTEQLVTATRPAQQQAPIDALRAARMAQRRAGQPPAAATGATPNPAMATPAPPPVAANPNVGPTVAMPNLAALAKAQPPAPAQPVPAPASEKSDSIMPKSAQQATPVASVPPGTPKSDPPAATASAAPAPGTPKTEGAGPVPVYYELPYNVRKDLPTLALNMHVYATDPAQRFVVLDGDRRAEGETIKDGLVLREIRTDGIVLEFRGQRFFYPRPGR